MDEPTNYELITDLTKAIATLPRRDEELLAAYDVVRQLLPGYGLAQMVMTDGARRRPPSRRGCMALPEHSQQRKG